MSDLLPCPFCGSSVNKAHAKDCYLSLMVLGGSVDALDAAWNRRAVPAQASAADGWKLVPVEPTEAMYAEAARIDNRCYALGNYHGAGFHEVWTAMVDAAPVPAQGEPGK